MNTDTTCIHWNNHLGIIQNLNHYTTKLCLSTLPPASNELHSAKLMSYRAIALASCAFYEPLQPFNN